MQNVLNSVKTFLVEEDGPTAVEYAVMLALIIIVCLTAIKADPRFGEFALVRHSRLSVMPVSELHWAILCAMAGVAP